MLESSMKFVEKPKSPSEQLKRSAELVSLSTGHTHRTVHVHEVVHPVVVRYVVRLHARRLSWRGARAIPAQQVMTQKGCSRLFMSGKKNMQRPTDGCKNTRRGLHSKRPHDCALLVLVRVCVWVPAGKAVCATHAKVQACGVGVARTELT